MSAKPSKQLGALLSRVPPATAAGQGATSLAPRSVPYAPPPEPALPNPKAEPMAMSDREVPLQVLIPEHVRKQLDRMRADTRKSIRQVTLEALRGIGLEISDEDIAGKRGRKKS